jgi:tetratricopeptide (TPR) repeat protein
VEILFLLGTFFDQGLGVKTDANEALSYYKKALAMGHSEAATRIDAIQNSGRMGKKTSEGDHLAKARKLYEGGSLKEASREIDLALKGSPNSPTCQYWTGVIYRDLGINEKNKEHTETALKSLKKAIELDPERGEYFHKLGVIHSDMEKYPEAVAAFTAALEKNVEKREQTFFGRGLCYSSQEMYSEAGRDFSEAININPQYADAYKQRSVAYQKSGNNEAAEEDTKKYEELRSY